MGLNSLTVIEVNQAFVYSGRITFEGVVEAKINLDRPKKKVLEVSEFTGSDMMASFRISKAFERIAAMIALHLD